jgi:hypothetical protein
MTAIEWLIENSHIIPKSELNKRQLIHKAKEMEKDQQGYSEEEVLKLVEDFEIHLGSVKVQNMLTFKKWFNQFKKKKDYV